MDIRSYLESAINNQSISSVMEIMMECNFQMYDVIGLSTSEVIFYFRSTLNDGIYVSLIYDGYHTSVHKVDEPDC